MKPHHPQRKEHLASSATALTPGFYEEDNPGHLVLKEGKSELEAMSAMSSELTGHTTDAMTTDVSSDHPSESTVKRLYHGEHQWAANARSLSDASLLSGTSGSAPPLSPPPTRLLPLTYLYLVLTLPGLAGDTKRAFTEPSSPLYLHFASAGTIRDKSWLLLKQYSCKIISSPEDSQYYPGADHSL